MNTIVTLLISVTIYLIGHTQRLDEVPECGDRTTMDQSKRRVVLQQHNWKRFFLAGGDPYREGRQGRYPPASDMSVLYYDCGLEISAYEIAKECRSGRPDFDYVGSNNETFNDRYFAFSYIDDALNRWWNTGLKGSLEDLTPSQENSPMIPFLQMANGKTNRVGCAYHVCNDDDENAIAFTLFVCKYGDAQIEIGRPIYTQGEPCDSCKHKCIYYDRLCDTVNA